MPLTESERGDHQILVLEATARDPGATAREIAHQAGLPPLLVHRAIQHLLDAGLLETERNGARVGYRIRPASR